MLSAILRSRSIQTSHLKTFISPFSTSLTTFTDDHISNNNNKIKELLSLAEVEKVLKDVGADDVTVISSNKTQFTDYVVIATGRSPWHVRNISQALLYKVKQKQKGVKRMLLPTVVGQEGGKWIVIDSGTLIVHAVDENARAYYNLEGLWTSSDTPTTEQTQDLENAFVKLRRKNNSKKPSQVQVNTSAWLKGPLNNLKQSMVQFQKPKKGTGQGTSQTYRDGFSYSGMSQDFLGDDFKSQGSHVPYNAAEFSTQGGYAVDYMAQGVQGGFPGSYLHQNSQAGYAHLSTGKDYMSQEYMNHGSHGLLTQAPYNNDQSQDDTSHNHFGLPGTSSLQSQNLKNPLYSQPFPHYNTQPPVNMQSPQQQPSSQNENPHYNG